MDNIITRDGVFLSPVSAPVINLSPYLTVYEDISIASRNTTKDHNFRFPTPEFGVS